MRIQEINMLNDTLRIFEERFFISKGKRRDIKLSKEALKDAKVLLPGQVEYICNNPETGEIYKKEDSKYLCENEDSFSAALRIKKANPDDKVLVLNFANPVNPGGGVRRGARAQEEDLCRKSSLLLSLEGDDARGYYKYNRSLNSLMGSDAIIINPTVEIIKDAKGELLDDSVIVSVMTCAAPMISRGLEGMREEEYEALFFNRIVATLKVAAYYKYKYLVLGAWGCGAFSNDAKIVSRLYFKALEEVKYSDIYLKDLFKEIYFAVLSRSADKCNYNAFAEYFKI